MNNVSSETHNACSHEMPNKSLVKANSNRKNTIGPKFVRKFCPPPSMADLKPANKSPRKFKTNIIAFTIIGSTKTAMNARSKIKNHLSFALVLETTTKTAMYRMRNTITVAKINHKMKNRGSPILI